MFGELRAIELTVLEDGEAPKHCFERYTLTVRSEGWRGKAMRSPGAKQLMINAPEDGKKAADRVKRRLGHLFRTLIPLCSTLPKLPGKSSSSLKLLGWNSLTDSRQVSRGIGIRLVRRSDSPEEYEPPGFGRSKKRKVYFPEEAGWVRKTDVLGVWNTGYHT